MADSHDEQLLPCPFCGGEAKEPWWNNRHYYRIECKKCGIQGALYAVGRFARKKWNNRHEEGT